MFKRLMLTGASALLGLGILGSAQAYAETVEFTISDGTEPTESFETLISPTPVVSIDPALFVIEGTDVKMGGVAAPDQLYGFTIFASLEDQSGDYDLVGTNEVSPSIVGDANYFTGTVSAPTFVEGTFLATNTTDYTTATVTITAVPEASTWAMMLLGFIGLGFVAHRRATKRGLAAFSAS